MGLWDTFESFSDNQRITRLRGCREFEEDVAKCEAARKAYFQELSRRQKQEEKDREDASNGGKTGGGSWGWFRSSRGGSETNTGGSTKKEGGSKAGGGSVVEGNRNESSSSPADSSSGSDHHPPNCHGVEHILWHCRALSLGCGPDLVGLNRCYREVEESSIAGGDKSYERLTINELAAVDVAREQCVELRKAMELCVSKKARELEDRLKERRKDEEK